MTGHGLCLYDQYIDSWGLYLRQISGCEYGHGQWRQPGVSCGDSSGTMTIISITNRCQTRYELEAFPGSLFMLGWTTQAIEQRSRRALNIL